MNPKQKVSELNGRERSGKSKKPLQAPDKSKRIESG